ncbi:SDR family NAD(P)-dependent oxidoreductase [Streptomyces sp. NPDC051776]|uniref:SDR family NAD(P)-dependent oxidoreductase n=1 Tax=Streptomyces sp. NPDC051776 TaxID=3155414 RepID=UPI00341ECB68
MTPEDRESDAAPDTDGTAGEPGVRALLLRLVAERCAVAPEDIDTDRPLADYGLSSRDAVGLSEELQEALGRTLPATLLWENPSVTALVRRLTGTTPGWSPEGRTETARAAAKDTRRPETRRGGEPVAVVGIGCRLPGGIEGPDSFWEFLLNGRDAVSVVPEERWQDYDDGSAAVSAALARTPRWGGFLTDIAGFDAEFFGITPREAQLMDPQQRLLLEVAWEALDHAGIPAPSLRAGPTGVFVGLSSLDYGLLTTADPARVSEWTSTGAAASIVANRLSYILDLRGPSLTIDTACSASLVALHQACRSLRAEECDTALAAGVNVLLSPAVTAGFELAGALAPDGRCKAFDASADGIARGEGCGVVVLKRLDDALRDGDRVLALVRGSAVNSDGRSAGMVAPNPEAQQALLRTATKDAGVDPADIDYVEAHGTGTLLGDPIEASALSAVMGTERPAGRPLLIGSVKSNIGHLEGAAGITGVIKTVLSLHHGTLPASLHFRTPNPHIDFEASRLRVVDETTPLAGEGGRPARAGVSAFGFGGTNAHAVLEQWKADTPASAQPTESGDRATAPPHTLLLSAGSAGRLRDTALALADWITSPAGLGTPAEDLAHTLGRHRYGPACAAVVGRDRDALAAGLRALGNGRPAAGVFGPRTLDTGELGDAGPVFVFSGYGSQWDGMGRGMLEGDEEFAAAVRALDPVFEAETGTTLSDRITRGVPPTAVEQVQPLLYGLQLALARTWQAYGVEPEAVIGHSMGEVAAAVVAGALDPRDGLRVMLRRAELLATVDAAQAGSMAAIDVPEDERAALLARFPGVAVAVDASPLRCTVTGPAGPVGRLVAELEESGAGARLLDVGGAGHSAAVDPVLPRLRTAFEGIEAREPAIPWYGTVHDDPRRTTLADAGHWCDNARRPVLLRQAVTAAAEDGHRTFLEISPHPVAALPVSETAEATAGRHTVVLPTLRRDSDEPVALRTSLAALHAAGVQERPEVLWPAGKRTALPTAPWRHVRHWVHDGPAARRTARPAGGHPLLGSRADIPGTRCTLWHGDVGTEGWYRPEQEVHGTAVLTLAACAEMVLAAAAEIFGAPVEDIVVRDLALRHLQPLSASTPVTTLLEPTGPGCASVSINARSDAGSWTSPATAVVECLAWEGFAPDGLSPETFAPGSPGPQGAPAPGEPGPESYTVRLLPPDGTEPDNASAGWHLHPALFDACLRAPASASAVETADAEAAPDRPRPVVRAAAPDEALPVGIGTLRVRRTGPAATQCRIRPASPRSADTETEGDTAPVRSRWSLWMEDSGGTALVEAEDVLLRVPTPGEVPLPLHETVFEIAWDKTTLPASATAGAAPTDWLLLTVGPGEEGRQATALRAALEQEGTRVTVAPADPGSVDRTLTAWRNGVAEGDAAAVAVLFAEAAGATSAREAVLGCAAVASALAAVTDGGTTRTAPRLCLVTERSLAVNAAEKGDPDRACLRGLLRVLALEHPHLRPCLIDIDRSPGAVEDLARELLGDGDADQVAWRAGTRFTARLAPADLGKDAVEVTFARAGGAYIVTGGLGGLGLATARRLAERGAGRLVLNGRRAPGPEAEAELAEMRGLGVSVEVVQGDIAEPGTASRLVEAAVREGHRLCGVAHAAGVLRDRVVTGLEPADLDAVFRPKVDGARHLDEATAGHDLDWWLAFSSAAALFGSPGQAAYAAANAWLDALVQQRRARGAPGESIAWGPWAGLGAAPDMTTLALEPITPGEGLDALQLIVTGGRPYTGVVRLDVRRVVEAFPGLESVPYFAGLVRGATDEAADWGGPEALRALPAAAALDAVRARLAQRTATVMGYPDQQIDTTVPLTRLGLDSLMAVRIRNAVKQDFGTVLSETLLLRDGTLDDVAEALSAALGMHAAPVPAEKARTAARPALPRGVLPRDAAERLVAGVWTHLSGEAPDGVHQELPGLRDDAAGAGALAAGIRARLEATDVAPTAEQIRQSPTVAALADLIRPSLEGSTGGTPLRVLRDPGSATDRLPLFVFHPAGGPTSVYRPLTGLLPAELPVYGLDRVDAMATVEEKAEYYMGLIRGVQPQGPYRLLGWSFGGCLAYETALRLHDRGEHVGFVGLIDTILPAALPGPEPEDILLERFARFAEYVETAYGRPLRLPYEEMARMDEQNQIDTLMRHVADAGLDMSPGVLEHQRTSYIDARIGERYLPRPYSGPVVLYRAQEAQVLTTAIDPRYLRDDRDLGWAPLCPGLQVVPVPGDHLSLIDPPHVEVIAQHLTASLDEHT